MIVVEQLPVAPPAGSAIDPLPLTWEQRSKTRQQVVSRGGCTLALKLPTGTRLPPGTVVHVGGGFHVEVTAADEEVWLVCAADAQTLARVAYELGNRHFPIELGVGCVAALYDHTLEALWARLGVRAERACRPFLPDQQPTHAHR
jgi:urease accessory protein